MKVAVVGGGFAGLAMAQALARRGYSVVLYEEHQRVGYPPHCTGIVSEYVVSSLGRQARLAVEASYAEVVFVEREGARLVLKTRDRIYKLERVRLEEEMLEEAKGLGVEARLGLRVEQVTPNGLLIVDGRREEYDLIVLAEGYHGRLRRALGLDHEPLTSTGVNIVARLPRKTRVDTITILFDESLLPRGFAWLVPLDSGVHVIGALSLDTRRARPVAEKLAERLGAAVRGSYGGVVIHGPPSPSPGKGRVVLAGDAAALNKPLTGGGLYPNTRLAALTLTGTPYEAAYSLVARKLRRQHPIARTLLGDARIAAGLLRAAAAAGTDEVVAGKLGFDDHEDIVKLMLASPRKSVALLARLARRPRAVARLALAGLATLLP